MATTNFSDRVQGATQTAFAELGEGYGAAEGNMGLSPAIGMIAGEDPANGRGYITQVFYGSGGGPALAGGRRLADVRPARGRRGDAQGQRRDQRVALSDPHLRGAADAGQRRCRTASRRPRLADRLRPAARDPDRDLRARRPRQPAARRARRGQRDAPAGRQSTPTATGSTSTRSAPSTSSQASVSSRRPAPAAATAIRARGRRRTSSTTCPRAGSAARRPSRSTAWRSRRVARTDSRSTPRRPRSCGRSGSDG